MFERKPADGFFERWAQGRRARRGIDKWPVVDAKVIRRETISDGEGSITYRLSLEYRGMGISGDKLRLGTSLKVDSDTTLATAYENDIVQVRCNPQNGYDIRQEDVTQEARDLRTWVIFGGVALIVIIYFCCGGRINWGGDFD